jgi:hypothetical protein
LVTPVGEILRPMLDNLVLNFYFDLALPSTTARRRLANYAFYWSLRCLVTPVGEVLRPKLDNLGPNFYSDLALPSTTARRRLANYAFYWSLRCLVTPVGEFCGRSSTIWFQMSTSTVLCENWVPNLYFDPAPFYDGAAAARELRVRLVPAVLGPKEARDGGWLY